MALSPENREKLLAVTKPAAAALLEDLIHIREVLARREPSRGELRRLSVVLRRLLVEGDLSQVACPRIQKFFLRAPDHKLIYKLEEKIGPYDFFFSGGAWLYDVCQDFWVSSRLPDDAVSFLANRKERYVLLRLDNFMSQRVIRYQEQWINRRTVIKYVANIAGGAHSDSPRDSHDKALAALSRQVSYSAFDPTSQSLQGLRIKVPEINDDIFRYAPDHIDPVLAEMLATAHFLIESEHVIKLDAMIKEEFGIQNPAI